ncbi:MAG: LamG domain-containing protein, partial [Candidatus Micrarchaeia archaeon]
MSPLTGGQILSGNWYHVAVTWGNGGRSIYLNGVQIASDSQTPSYTPSQFIYIGKTFANYGFYNGYVDEVKLYNSAF